MFNITKYLGYIWGGGVGHKLGPVPGLDILFKVYAYLQ